jgi:hypothetical protein
MKDLSHNSRCPKENFSSQPLVNPEKKVFLSPPLGIMNNFIKSVNKNDSGFFESEISKDPRAKVKEGIIWVR